VPAGRKALSWHSLHTTRSQFWQASFSATWDLAPLMSHRPALSLKAAGRRAATGFEAMVALEDGEEEVEERDSLEVR
jgi:hypothetical protein